MSTKTILGALLLSLMIPAAAAAGDDDAYVLRLGTTLIVRPIHQPMPYYRTELQDVGVRGRVVLVARIDAEGRVSPDIQVLEGHPLLIDASRRALARWTFDRELTRGAENIPLRVTFKFELTAWPTTEGAVSDDGLVVAYLALIPRDRLGRA